MDLQLFLAHADDHGPVLEDGMPWSAVEHAPKPTPDPPRGRLLSTTHPPDDLQAQRWAAVAPKGAAGDRLLELVAPLLAKRGEDQGEKPLVYRVDPGMGPDAAVRWAQQDYWDAVGRREEEVPGYLLLLGGPDLVSWELQQLLGAEAHVGRLAFPNDGGYEAYVDKVLRWEREKPVRGARALFFTARDGTSATAEGYRYLMQPSLENARAQKDRAMFPATEIVEIGGGGGQPSGEDLVAQAQQMLGEAGRSRAGLLFSMSHGAGVPRSGWRSPEEQRARQGAMMISRTGVCLTAGDIAAQPFLPGGAWFFFACYGAGTPARSAYHPWLDRLHKLGRVSAPERVLAALPKPGELPFVAALPQAALANPNGPLGVIGHVDLAWSWGFLDYEYAGAQTTTWARPERFQGVPSYLVKGHRLGVALHHLARSGRSKNTEITTLEGWQAQPADTSPEAQARNARWASLWMQRHDLSAYVLLGDPAARLPIAQYPQGVPEPQRAERPPPTLAAFFGFNPEAPAAAGEGRDLRSMEEAVVAVIRGAAEGAVARQHKVEEAELRRWVGAFLDAGRAALRKLM